MRRFIVPWYWWCCTWCCHVAAFTSRYPSSVGTRPQPGPWVHRPQRRTTQATSDPWVWGRVVRVAAKAYNVTHSKPSQPFYTTLKPTVSNTDSRHNARPARTMRVTRRGLDGDYNHYRSTVLQNTTDRAVSLVTTDCYDLIRSFGVQWGDLGENILVDGVPHTFFQPHATYRIERQRWNDSDSAGLGHETSIHETNETNDTFTIDIRITEAMVPCANLCTLPCVRSNDTLTRLERVHACQELLHVLDQAPGWRGWYATVVREGSLALDSGTIVRALGPDSQ